MSGCGSCTLCCKVMSVPEIDKPADEWCQHVDPKSGCSIYKDRPQLCRGFECVWLQAQKREHDNLMKTTDLRPDRCMAVVVSIEENDSLMVTMDPHHPNGYKQGALARLIKNTPKLPWVVNVAGTSTAKAINESSARIYLEQELAPSPIEEEDV